MTLDQRIQKDLTELYNGGATPGVIQNGKPIRAIIANTFSIQALPTKKRFYDVYSDGKGCHIVNTWAQGGNTYPSADFEKEEEMLFRKKQIIP